MRLYVKKEIKEIIELILGFMKALTQEEPRAIWTLSCRAIHIYSARSRRRSHII